MKEPDILYYLVLGPAGSGRREVLADLIEGGLGEGDTPAVILAANEAPSPHDARLGAIVRGNWTPSLGEAPGTFEAGVPAGANIVFVVTDGRADPVDQIEAFKAWTDARGVVVARVLCVVDCALTERHHPLVTWFEACIHFSDVVLLNRREGVPNKWISDFQARFTDKFFPCLFEFVREGRVRNPAAILVPEARRMSHAFEDEPDWMIDGGDEGDELDAEDETQGEGEEEVEVRMAVDPWFERRHGGRRVKPLPDITAFLDAPKA